MVRPDARKRLAWLVAKRREALGSKEWQHFVDTCRLAEAYFEGRQKPKNWTDRKHDPYMVLNLVRDVVRRGASLITGGVLNTELRQVDPSASDLLDVERLDHERWMNDVRFSTRMATSTEHLWLYGGARNRHFVDIDELFTRRTQVVKLGLQAIRPYQVVYDLQADDPLDQLCGSSWVCFDDFIEVEDLIEQFPKFAEKIRRLNSLEGGETLEGSLASTVIELADRLEQTGSPYGSEVARPGDEEGRYLLISIWQWKEREWHKGFEGFGDGRLPTATWKQMITVASPFDEYMTGNVLILDDRPLKMGRPTLSAWCVEPPYGASIVPHIMDAQNMTNVLASVMIKKAMLIAREGQKYAIASKWLSKETRDALFVRRLTPDVFAYDLPEGMRIEDVIKILTAPGSEMGWLVSMVDYAKRLIDDTGGMASVVKGTVSPGSRMAASALAQLQQAVLTAQELMRLHVAEHVSIEAMIGREMRRYYMAEPRPVMAEGPMGYLVNVRIPVTSEEQVRQAIIDPYVDEETTGGVPMVINGVRVKFEDGSEQVMPLSMGAYEWGEDLVERGEAAEVMLTANDLGVMDIEYTIEVEQEAEERRQAKRTLIFDVEKIRPGLLDDQTIFEATMGDVAEISYEEYVMRKYGHSIAADLLKATPEEQQAVGQFLAALRQQQGGNTANSKSSPTNVEAAPAMLSAE